MEHNGAIGVTVVEDESQQHLQEAIQEFPADSRNIEVVIAKLNLQRTDIAEFVAQVGDTDWARHVQMMALLGSGVLYLVIPVASDTDFQQLADALTQLRQSVMTARGNLIIETAPSELKRYIDVWGSVGGTLSLMKQVKAKFDPDGLLNPGRFISSI